MISEPGYNSRRSSGVARPKKLYQVYETAHHVSCKHLECKSVNKSPFIRVNLHSVDQFIKFNYIPPALLWCILRYRIYVVTLIKCKFKRS